MSTVFTVWAAPPCAQNTHIGPPCLPGNRQSEPAGVVDLASKRRFEFGGIEEETQIENKEKLSLHFEGGHVVEMRPPDVYRRYKFIHEDIIDESIQKMQTGTCVKGNWTIWFGPIWPVPCKNVQHPVCPHLSGTQERTHVYAKDFCSIG